jgi:hypothetical protein
MTIYNKDGTPFRPVGSVVQFDPESPDHALFNSFDQEAIKIGGSPLFYYELFIQFQTIDKLYLEDRGKLWSPIGIQLHGYYEPLEPQNPSTQFGIDGVGDVLFECNYRAVLEAIGHQPKRGSRIQTPHLNEFWVVVDTRLTQFQLWGALHIQLICERFQESTTTGDSNSPPPKPDFQVW